MGGLGGAPPGDADGVGGGSIGVWFARSAACTFPTTAHPVFCLPPAQSLLAIRSNPLADSRCKNLGDDLRLGPVLCNCHQPEILGE